MSIRQANVMNKMWYGQTTDGSVVSPATDNGWNASPVGKQLWWGLSRGTNYSVVAGSPPISLSTDFVAVELQDPTLAAPTFINATGNGANRWTSLSYADLADAFARGNAMQSVFANINSNNPDLNAYRARGGKMVVYHGLADSLVPVNGTIHYRNRVADLMGGSDAIQSFYALYLVPGMGHGINNGTSNPGENPPLPTKQQLYTALTNWVENGIAPGRLDIGTAASAAFPVVKSRPLCLYPLQSTYISGDPNQAISYGCS